MTGKIKIAIAGLGNCASSLIQGLHYYKEVRDEEKIPGLMHVNFGGYRPSDVELVAVFDINTLKIGKDVSEAIYADPNSSVKFADVPHQGVSVLPGPIKDGVAKHMKTPFHCYDPEETQPVNIVEALISSKADMLINYLPVGSKEGTKTYAEAALDAGIGFINCIPEFITSDESWAKRFTEAGLPCTGDDIKSQLGATIIHRTLADLMMMRGIQLEETYQLNIGGNTDFLNMTEEDRLKTKRISKTSAVTSLIPYDVPVRIGPSDYVEFLEDKKICYIYMKGKKFGDQPVSVTLKLSVEDSPNSAGVVIDAIRGMKLALDREIVGPLTSISSFFFKHPPIQVPDSTAREWVEDFIAGKRDR